MTLLEAKNIGASYSRGGKDETLFSNVSFCLHAGKVYDLVGVSGSGKSTLLRILSLMIENTSGYIYLEGKESSHFAPTEWRRLVCLVPQTSALVPGTVRDNLILPWKLRIRKGDAVPPDEDLSRLLAYAGLANIELERDVSQLSGGQIARIALLRVFVTKPRVLLLDEVDAALDSESAEAIGRLTDKFVGVDQSCLRIRHRVADGLASGVFTLADGMLSYKDASKDE